MSFNFLFVVALRQQKRPNLTFEDAFKISPPPPKPGNKNHDSVNSLVLDIPKTFWRSIYVLCPQRCLKIGGRGGGIYLLSFFFLFGGLQPLQIPILDLLALCADYNRCYRFPSPHSSAGVVAPCEVVHTLRHPPPSAPQKTKTLKN